MAFLSFLGIDKKDKRTSGTEKFLSFLGKGVEFAANPTKPIQKPIRDIGVSAARSLPRSIASFALQASDEKQSEPSTYNRAQRILLGSEPVKRPSEENKLSFLGPAAVPASIGLTTADLIPLNPKNIGKGAVKSGVIDDIAQGVKPNIDLVAKEAENLTKRLVETTKGLAKPSERLEETLVGTNAAQGTQGKTPFEWLRNLKDTHGVVSDFFGKVGSDVTYKLAQGAKTVSDLQETYSPLVQKSQKLLNGLAKTKAGRADVQRRVFSALEDRGNATQYLTNPKEQELFDTVKQVFEGFRNERGKRGLGTLENYAPRAEISDALTAPERLLEDISGSFKLDPTSRFSRERVRDQAAENIDTNIVELLPRYVSSQSKEFGYSEPLSYFKNNIDKVEPAYLTDPAKQRQGEQYLSTLFQQVLNPRTPNKLERGANRAIQTTYKSTLGFSPRFALQNLTQRYATGMETARGTKSLSKKIDKDVLAEVRTGLTSGKNPISGEFQDLETGIRSKVSKLDPGQVVESGNINSAFDRGVAQQILESDAYKAARKQGIDKKTAVNQALSDPATKELAIRRGNVVVNDTQFGANIVTRPEFFREPGSFGFIPTVFFKQFQRFGAGMTENLAKAFSPKRARELDILKRGDPRQTSLVDYSRSAKALSEATDDVIKGIRRGEIAEVGLKDAQLYKKSLDAAIKTLDKEIKGASQIRAGKTIRKFAKMWAAATAIQFMFDGGEDPVESARFASPISATSSLGSGNVLDAVRSVPGLAVPALPRSERDIARKALNFVPGVGLAVNRGRDISRFVKTLGGNK